MSINLWRLDTMRGRRASSVPAMGCVCRVLRQDAESADRRERISENEERPGGDVLMGVPDLIRPLCHNYEPDSIDLDRDWRLVIKAIMQGGEWEQIQWAAQYYGKAKFEDVLRTDLEGNQTLARPVANFRQTLHTRHD